MTDEEDVGRRELVGLGDGAADGELGRDCGGLLDGATEGAFGELVGFFDDAAVGEDEATFVGAAVGLRLVVGEALLSSSSISN